MGALSPASWVLCRLSWPVVADPSSNEEASSSLWRRAEPGSSAGSAPASRPMWPRRSALLEGCWARPRSRSARTAAALCWAGWSHSARLGVSASRAPAPTGRAWRLAAAGVGVVEADRANRQMRRRRGKADAVDAEAAARAVRGGGSSAEVRRRLRRGDPRPRVGPPLRGQGPRRRGQPDRRARRHRCRASPTPAACTAKAAPHQRLRPPAPDPARGPVDAAAELALRALARRHQALNREIDTLHTELRRPCEAANPALLGARGAGPETAATLLIAPGDNPHRTRSEASFASPRGTNPAKAPSGPKARHRLNRRGNRQANNAPWRNAMTRPRVDQRTINHAPQRNTQAKTRHEIPRSIKRHTTPETHRPLTHPPKAPHRANPRQHRPQAGTTPTPAAHTPDIAPTHLNTRNRPHPQHRPLRALPPLAHPTPDSTNIGATTPPEPTPRRHHRGARHRKLERLRCPQRGKVSSCASTPDDQDGRVRPSNEVPPLARVEASR